MILPSSACWAHCEIEKKTCQKELSLLQEENSMEKQRRLQLCQQNWLLNFQNFFPMAIYTGLTPEGSCIQHEAIFATNFCHNMDIDKKQAYLLGH